MRFVPAMLIAFLLAAAPAAAEPPACRLCVGEEGSLTGGGPSEAKPMALDVRTSLDFDRVILTGVAGGTARLSPEGGRETSGALATMTGRAMNGEVVIMGEPGRQVRVELPTRIDLFGFAGGALAITRITSDLPILPRLDGEGRLRVRFGGELFVRGDAEGEYRGDVPITVDYL
jgi:hypothetical protein